MKDIYPAGGCFWGVQHFFDQFDGVVLTEVGYANGPDVAPTYEEVCASSGHAETVHVAYDDSVISLEDLLSYYFTIVDPLSVNRQGNDVGVQYRTGIYYTDEEQLSQIQKVCACEQEKAGQPLAVEVAPLQNFFRAEEYRSRLTRTKVLEATVTFLTRCSPSGRLGVRSYGDRKGPLTSGRPRFVAGPRMHPSGTLSFPPLEPMERTASWHTYSKRSCSYVLDSRGRSTL